MLKKIALLFSLLAALPACTTIEASTSGPEPVGVKPGDRTWGMRVTDMSIENDAGVNILKSDSAFQDSNITVTSFYGSVLLTGRWSLEEIGASEPIGRRFARHRLRRVDFRF